MAPKETAQRIQALAEARQLPEHILIVARERIRRERVLEALLVGRAASELTRRRGSALTVDELASLKAELQALSLFAPERIFVLEGVDEVGAAQQKALALLCTLAHPGNSLILTAGELPKGSALRKVCGENAVLELSALTPTEALSWIGREMKQQGLQPTAESAQAVAAVAAGSLDEAARVIQYLGLYSNDGSLTPAEIFALFPDHPDPNDFALLDAINRRDRKGAETTLSQLLNAGKSPFLIVSLLCRSFFTYFLLRSLLDQKQSPSQIQEALDLKPWLYQKHVAAVQKRPLEKLHSSLSALLAADSRLKNRSLGSELVLSACVANLVRS